MSRILIILDHKENRRLLANILSPHYEVILGDAENSFEENFDLCIIGGRALDRLEAKIPAKKEAALPAILPFLLVTSRQDVGLATRRLWKTIDEVLISPIEQVELLARITSLLKIRQYSLEFNRVVVESSPLAIFLVDRNNRVTLWNTAAEQMLGWKKADAVGQYLPVLFNRVEDELGRLITKGLEGEQYTGVEIRRLTKEGYLGEFSVAAAPLRNEMGVIINVIVIVEDVTERKRKEQELEAVAYISSVLRQAQTREEMLKLILNELMLLMKANGAAIALQNPATDQMWIELGTGDFESATGLSIAKSGGAISQAILNGQTYITNAADPDFSGAEPQLLGRNLAVACVPLIAFEKTIGAIWIGRNRPIDHYDVRLLTAIADIAANAIHRLSLHEQTQKDALELSFAYDATIAGWSKALELKDQETEGHSQRVTAMTVRLAQAMGLPEDELVQIKRGALLHDIGKMGIPDSILLKPGKLTPEEWIIMKKHTTYAYDLLSPIPYLKPALDIPYYHHERWDGTGYPCGLKGKEIPLAARMFAVVDVWDALRSERPYHPSWPHEEVMKYIAAESGTHFDPEIVDLFLRVMAEDSGTEQFNNAYADSGLPN